MLKLRFVNKNMCFKFLQYCHYGTIENLAINKPTLYGDEISPPVRFIMMTASILGIDLNFHKIDLFKNENKSEYFTKINPLQKVPVLMVGDISICDSHAIAIYLCHICNGSSLYPNEPLLRAKINQMLFFNSSTLFRIDSDILSAYFSQQWPVNDKKIEEWLLALDYLEYNLNKNIWLNGTKMYLADICTFPVVTSMAQLFVLTDRHPKVRQWIKKFENYPFYEINKKGLSDLQNLIDMIKNGKS